ncbi:MAG: FtsW/RodA/SpoVE family cell cycle protein, partial [Rhodospirillales bacterium]|nr:FtsW/RodA/SpoVE family cell cycle protein [Rhodospirillales bacterium]
MARYRIGEPSLTIWQKLWNINWVFVLMITLTSCIGFAMLYSAAGGNMDPWASRQMTRFAMGFVIMLSVALVDIRIWLRYAYFIYIGGLAMLIGVEVAGTIGMGAQRWINLGVITVQPSEVMKIAMVLALARYFHST